MNALLQSATACAAVDNLRAALVTEHSMIPEYADHVARRIVASRTWADRFLVLHTLTRVPVWSAFKLLRSQGLLENAS